jgi:hypothetical protein
MKDDWRPNHDQLPPPEFSNDQPDGFVSLAILAFVIVAPLIYFGAQIGAVEDWFISIYRFVESWAEPIKKLLVS